MFRFNPFTGTLDDAGSAVGGDVVGPPSATDNAIARYDGTTGKLIQSSLPTIDDTGLYRNAAALAISDAGFGLDAGMFLGPVVTNALNTGRGLSGLRVYPAFSGAANYNSALTGVEIGNYFEGTGSLIGLYGLTIGNANDSGSAITHLWGIDTSPRNSAGLAETLRGIVTHPIVGSTGSATNVTGVYVQNPSKSGSGTVTNNYGVYIEAQTRGATLNYNIFSAGAGSKNLFEGHMILTGLPTSDPNVAGELWNDAGTLKVSAG